MVGDFLIFINNNNVAATILPYLVILVAAVLITFLVCLVQCWPKSKKQQQKELRELLDNQPKPGIVYRPNIPPSRMMSEDDPPAQCISSYTYCPHVLTKEEIEFEVNRLAASIGIKINNGKGSQ